MALPVSPVHLRWLRVTAGVLLLAGLVAYLTPRALLAQVEAAKPAWLMAAAAAILLATVLGTFALFLLVGRDRALPFRGFLGAYWMSWGVGLVVPGQIGDMATLTALMHRRGLHWPTSLGRILLDKAISLVVLGSFAAWELSVRLPGLSKSPIAILAVASGLVLVLLMVWIALRKVRRGDGTGSAIKATVVETMRSVRHDPGRTLANVCLTILKFALIVLAYWCVFQALGQDQLEYQRALPLVATSALVAYIPVSFNGLGTVEFAGIALFGSAGVEQSAVLSAYLLLRVMVLAIAWLPLLAALAFSRPPRPA